METDLYKAYPEMKFEDLPVMRTTRKSGEEGRLHFVRDPTTGQPVPEALQLSPMLRQMGPDAPSYARVGRSSSGMIEDVLAHEIGSHGVELAEKWPADMRGLDMFDQGAQLKAGSPEYFLSKELKGPYGKKMYPGEGGESRINFGMYEHQIPEVFSRMVGGRAFLRPEDMPAHMPTPDIPYPRQISSNDMGRRIFENFIEMSTR